MMTLVPGHRLCVLKHTRVEQIYDTANPAGMTDHTDFFPASIGALSTKFYSQYIQNIGTTAFST